MTIKRRLITLLALFAFVGQSFAAVYSTCSMPMSKQTSVVEMQMDHMDHSMHGMSDQGAQESTTPPCCGDIDCSMLQCGYSFSAVVGDDSHSGIGFYSEHVKNLSASYQPGFRTSLFRPPISR